jgi:hypothetical protein
MKFIKKFFKKCFKYTIYLIYITFVYGFSLLKKKIFPIYIPIWKTFFHFEESKLFYQRIHDFTIEGMERYDEIDNNLDCTIPRTRLYIFFGIESGLANLERKSRNSLEEMNNYYFITPKRVKKHMELSFDYYQKKHVLERNLDFFEKEFQINKPKGKQIFCEIDPYGEELWED